MSAPRSAPVVLITGASAGIGLEIARLYASRRAALILCARNAAALESAAAELRRAGATSVEVVAGDVTSDSVQHALVERARSLGGLDVLINNAGRGYYASFADIEARELTPLFALNVIAPVALTQRALPLLTARRGVVVMVSSVAGVAAAPGMGAYAASKFALEALSHALRAEMAQHDVQVLVVRPGPVATGFREHAAATGNARLETPSSEKDERQSPADVAKRVLRAVDRRAATLETSWYVRGVSFVARTMPPLVRLAMRRMARGR